MRSRFAITDNGSGRVGSGPRAWACLYCCHIQSCGSWPARLNQSSICAVESTWSSCLPFGKTVSSCRYSASYAASFGRCTNPFSIIAVWACTRMILVRLRLVTGDRMHAVGDQLLDQLGAGRLVLDQYDISHKSFALLAHRPLQHGILHALAQYGQQVKVFAPDPPARAPPVQTD
jgi:hypothetical protein